MTNNLKAERTLTAEELQFVIALRHQATGSVEPEHSMMERAAENIEELQRRNRELNAELGGVRRSYFEERKKVMALQSLSTQQPMGEPVAYRVRMDRPFGGVWQLRHVLHDWERWDIVEPLYALHPNQESGE